MNEKFKSMISKFAVFNILPHLTYVSNALNMRLSKLSLVDFCVTDKKVTH